MSLLDYSYKGFLIVSGITFLIAIGTTEIKNVNIGAIITTYVSLILSALIILTIVSNKSVLDNVSLFQNMKNVLITTGPLLIMLGVLSFVLYLLIYYKNKILDGKISNDYYKFINITTIIILVEMSIIYYNNALLTKVVSGCLLLIGLSSIVSLVILYEILHFYETDGFTIR